jgi:hypothetical protein
MGLRSSALDDTIGQRITNESLKQDVPAEADDDDEGSDRPFDLQPNATIYDKIGVLPNDDLATIEKKYLRFLIARGDQLAAEIGTSDWLDEDDRVQLLAEEAADDTGSTDGGDARSGREGEGMRRERVDLNSPVPEGEEKAFVKAVCRQILFVRNLPKKITSVRHPPPAPP